MSYRVANYVLFVIVLEPVYDEYSQLETKYEIEKGCRTQAEEFATKVMINHYYD